MDKVRAKHHIKFLAEEDKIALTTHAQVRSPTKGKHPLTREQIKQCLIHGVIIEGPAEDMKEPDGWKFVMRRVRQGEKHEVAGVLVVEKNVLVITGYGWDATTRPQKGQKNRSSEKRPPEQDDDE